MRAGQLFPGLLNTWLKKDHINIRFWNAAVERPELDVKGCRLDHNHTYFKAIYEENGSAIVLNCRYHYQPMCIEGGDPYPEHAGAFAALNGLFTGSRRHWLGGWRQPRRSWLKSASTR
ncbi:hypothetical protein ACJZ2D_011600 [Fusarium nematophilum]